MGILSSELRGSPNVDILCLLQTFESNLEGVGSERKRCGGPGGPCQAVFHSQALQTTPLTASVDSIDDDALTNGCV